MLHCVVEGGETVDEGVGEDEVREGEVNLLAELRGEGEERCGDVDWVGGSRGSGGRGCEGEAFDARVVLRVEVKGLDDGFVW